MVTKTQGRHHKKTLKQPFEEPLKIKLNFDKFLMDRQTRIQNLDSQIQPEAKTKKHRPNNRTKPNKQFKPKGMPIEKIKSDVLKESLSDYTRKEAFLTTKLKNVISTTHKFHLVDPSPWPLMASLGALMLTVGGVLYMHRVSNGWSVLLNGLILILYVMYVWWRDVVREATYERNHTASVYRGLRLGVIFFVVSEVMFFFGFFWAFFHSSLSPVHNIGGVWPPKAVTVIEFYMTPLTNTILLLSSGATITWAHHAVLMRSKKHATIGLTLTLVLAGFFTYFQGLEYNSLPFNISDSVYGSCFYLTTGFHGFHVVVGTIALIIVFIRLIKSHFTIMYHLGLESAAWYWHFVDVVWLFLFATVYCWGNSTSHSGF